MFTKFISLMTIFIVFNLDSSFAKTKVNTECALTQSTGELVGVKTDVPFTIASVSKVFTSFWAIEKLGGNYRFPHQIAITPIAGNIVDIHIQGDSFPYFDKVMLQYLVAQLNTIGVRAIRNLSFDESFEYSSSVRTNSALAHQNIERTENDIRKDLLKDFSSLQSGWSTVVAKTFALKKIKLPSQISLEVKNVIPLSSKDVRHSATARFFIFETTPLHRVIKEMNRNSHNFAADTLFKKLQLQESFEDFIARETDIPPAQFSFYNGSGYPTGFEGKKVYNQASCGAVVTMMAAFDKELQNQNLHFADVLAVSGKDSEADGESTVSQIYGDKLTDGVLIAKTGTVADTVALAGVLSTEIGPLYFHTSYNYNSTATERSQAYANIKERLRAVLNGKAKKSPVDYDPIAFAPFDENSLLTQEELSNLAKNP